MIYEGKVYYVDILWYIWLGILVYCEYCICILHVIVNAVVCISIL